MSKKQITFTLLFALVLPILLAACGPAATEIPSVAETEAPAVKTEAPAMLEDAISFVDIPPGEPVHIAYMLATSGAVEVLGADSLGGIQIAIDDFGQIHGHDIQLTGEDSLCSPEGGQTAAQKVASDPTIIAVIGTNCSSAGTAASPVLSEAGILMMSPTNTSPFLTNPDKTWQPGYFRTAHNDLFQGAVAAEFVYNELGARSAAAIHDGDPYTEGLASSFRDSFITLGGEITSFEGVNKGDTDMRSVLTSIAASSPDVLYFPIFEPEGNFVGAQSSEVPGLENTTLMGADGLLVKSFAPNTGSAAVGMYLSGPYISADIPEYAAFLAQYEANTGGPPPAGFAAHAFDATNIILAAIQSVAIADDDGTLHVGRQALRDAVEATSGYVGLTGVLSCGDKEFQPGKTYKGDCATGEALAVFELTGAQVSSDENWPPPVVYTPVSGAIQIEETMEVMVDLSGQTVVFWHVWGSGSAAEGMTKIIDDFNATNEWGITVEGVDQGRQGDLQDAVNAAIASGDLPNVTPGFPNAIATWYDVGAIAELEQFITDPKFGLTTDEVDAIHDANMASGTLADGTQIGMPIHQSENVLFYNHTWAQELGFASPPATSAEFKEQACAAAEANANDDNPDNDGTGGLVLFPGASDIASWLFAFGGGFLNDAGDAYNMNTPEMKAVFLFLKDLSDNSCTFATDSFPNPEFATRLALFTSSSTAGISFQLAAFEDAGNDDEWGLLAFPGPDGNLAVNAFGQMIGVVDQNPEANLASWLWLKHFTSPEIQAEWITFSAYFPSQTTTAAFLGDYIADNPIYATGVELAKYGQSEPTLASWGAVRGALTDAGFAMLGASDESEIDAVIADLDAVAAELLAESQ